MPKKPADQTTDLSIFSRYLWGGERFRIAESDDEVFELICADGTGRTKTLPRAEIAALLKSGDLVEEQGVFDAEGKFAPQNSPYRTIAACKVKDHKPIMRRLIWVRDHLHPAWLNGDVKLTEASLKPWIQAKHEEVEAQLRAVFGEKSKKARRGQPAGIAPPSVSALKRDHLMFRKPGFVASDFRSKTENCVYGGKRLDPDLKAAALEVIRDIGLNEGRMTLPMLRAHLRAVLPPALLGGKNAPDEETLSRMIKDMPDARRIGACFGIKAMSEQTGMFSEGPRYTMAGEMIYLDCWKTDIVVLLKDCGVWMRLSRNVRRLLESVLVDRVWVCVAMCMASRAILGISFDIAETPELTRRTLRMAVSDRQSYAELSDCKQPPLPQIGVAGIRHDSGTAFTDSEFHFAALAVSGDTAIGLVGRPRYRGGLERFFRTVASQLLGYFTGRTFSNIVERGDYKSHERASLVLEAFGSAFFRYVNDVYHLRGHDGLSEQSPVDFFGEALESTGCPDVMDSDQLRLAFGVRKDVTLTGQGLRHMGVQYVAKWLGTVRRHHGQRMSIMVDPVDLGCISVLYENAWHTVPGPSEMKGVGLTQWMRTCSQLKRKHGAQAEVHWPIVAQALRDFAALGARAKVEAQLLDTSYDSQYLDAAEAAMTLRLVFRPSPSAFVAPLSITEGGLGKGFAVKGTSQGFAETPVVPDVPNDDHQDDEDNDIYVSPIDEEDVDSDLVDEVAPTEAEPLEDRDDTPFLDPVPGPASATPRPAARKARRIISDLENEDD